MRDRYKDTMMHAKWLMGQDKEGFENAHNSTASLAKMFTDSADNEFLKGYPETAKVLLACISKLDFEGYQERYGKTDFTTIHGDFHPKQMVWNKASQKTTLLDYEFLQFGNGILDVCYFLLTTNLTIRTRFEDKFLARYHEKMVASGKVDPAVYTLEKVKKDYVANFVPRGAAITIVCACFMPQFGVFVWPNMADFIEKNGITAENVLSPHYMFK